jgi:uncharacterized protein (TIGR03435 family)
MQKFRAVFRTHRQRCLSTAILIATAGAFALSMFFAMPGKAQSQTQATPPIKFEFDVASIKLNKSGETPRNLIAVDGIPMVGMFRAHNTPLIDLIRETYQLGIGTGTDDGRILGAPGWLNSDRFDIEAKIDSSVLDALKKLPPDERKLQAQHMMQALLAERFKLVVHTENRDLPVYSLVIAKNGPKLQESKPQDGNGGKAGTTGLQVLGRGGPIKGQGTPIADLVWLLSRITGRTVVDKTGLMGEYDFTLQWTPDEAQSPTFSPSGQLPDPNGPSIFAAIQEQLGLKLEAGKAPLPVIVIDHVERPSDN